MGLQLAACPESLRSDPDPHARGLRIKRAASPVLGSCRFDSGPIRYIRVGGAENSPSIQADETARLIDERGWQLVETYMERATSGSSARRPESARLMGDAGCFRCCRGLARADRLFDGTTSMVAGVDELIALGIGLVSVTVPFDTLAHDGHRFMRLISALADLESRVLAERTRVGLDAAIRRGSRIGRPPVHIDVERAVELRAAGKSLRETARILGVGAATLHRALNSR
jgi:DNA invertase Pin-like site-specific DNA recombinase